MSQNNIPPVPTNLAAASNEDIVKSINPKKFRQWASQNASEFKELIDNTDFTKHKSFIVKYYAVFFISVVILANYIVLYKKLPTIYHPLLSGSVILALAFICLIHMCRTHETFTLTGGLIKHGLILGSTVYLAYTAAWVNTNVPMATCQT